MKKLVVFVLILTIAGLAYYFLRKENPPAGGSPDKQYQDPVAGISFAYPENLAAGTADGVAILRHDIPYKNSGPCDMMGDEIKYDRLMDFEMKIRISEKGLTETVKTSSPYIPQENFVDGKVVASPGFIDPCAIGDLSGFAIYEGAEGCGQTTYYFPIAGNRTLVITNASIQALSEAIAPEKVAEVLAVPGVISREANQKTFESIVRSLRIR